MAATGVEVREGALAKQGCDLSADTVNASGGIKVGHNRKAHATRYCVGPSLVFRWLPGQGSNLQPSG